jgi:hypothetical protein
LTAADWNSGGENADMAATHETSALQSAPDLIGRTNDKAAPENQPENQIEIR